MRIAKSPGWLVIVDMLQARRMIAVPSPSVRAYLRASNIACVAVLADGAVTCVRDVGKLQQPAAEAWWSTAADALTLVRHCRKHETVDVLSSAPGTKRDLTGN
jgi:hypothetical protein